MKKPGSKSRRRAARIRRITVDEWLDERLLRLARYLGAKLPDS
jgi:hypothetical protein